MLAGLSAAADTAPLTDHGELAEQRLDNRQAVVPRHVLSAVETFKVDFSLHHIGIVADAESPMQGSSSERGPHAIVFGPYSRSNAREISC